VKERITLYSGRQRSCAKQLIETAPKDSVVRIDGPKRTLDQNGKMHAMIRDVSQQCLYFGERLAGEDGEDDWKRLFMHALKGELRMLRSLDGRTLVPMGASTKRLTIPHCADLIECIYAYGAQNGVVWTEPERWQHPTQTDRR